MQRFNKSYKIPHKKANHNLLLPVLLLFLLFIISKVTYTQIVKDTGQIFNEISGIISSMPGHSGNNYSDPDATELNSWDNILDYMLAANYAQADDTADGINYDVVQFLDTTETEHRTYYILKANGTNYWGTYVYNPNYCRPLVIQSPHPLKDFNTGKQGIHVFHKAEALFFCLSGTSRCNHTSHSTCDGTTTVCSGSSESYRISDLSHSVSSIYQGTTNKLLTSFSNTYFVQLHGFTKLASDPFVILSNGTQVTPDPDYIIPLKNNLLAEDNTLTFKIAHIDLTWTRLRGFKNTQGRLINSSTDACNADATTSNGRFIHIEQEKTKLRDNETGWDKLANALINTFTCYSFLWDGSTDTDWGTAANWRENSVPTSTDNISIPDESNDPVISGTIASPSQCNHLEIQSSATLTINEGKALTVNGDLKNYGTLSINSSETGTGSLIIEGSASGDYTVQCHITDNSWHQIAPVTTGVTANNFYWNDAPKSWLLSHDESQSGDDSWTYIINTATALNVGQGYMVWVDDNTKQDATATMTGNLQAENLSPTIAWTDASHGYNLVGNPFASAIDLGDGTGWTFTNVEATIWVWDNGSNNYLNRTTAGGGTKGNGIIPVGQGFFVHAIESSPILTIPTSARTHNTQDFYKNLEQTSAYESYLTLQATQEGSGRDEIWISFGTNGSKDFENGWDASKMWGSEEAPQLYMNVEDRIQSINHLYTLGEDERIIEISFIPGLEGVQSFNANLDHLSDTDVTIEDLKTGQFHKFHQNPVYVFTGSKEDAPARFLLHFKSNAWGIDESGNNSRNNMSIYTLGKNIYIQSQSDAANREGVLKLYDLLGRLVKDQKIGKGALIRIPVSYSNIYLVVRVIKDNEVVTEKVFIK